MYDRRRVNIWLKVQLLQAEVVETLLYGCASWSLTADHYTKLNGAHRLFLTRCIGWSKWKRTDRPLSYAETLLQTGCEETIDATVRERRLCLAGFVMRMEDNRLPKRVLLGTLPTGKGYRGGQDSGWVSHLGEDLVAFGLEEEKERARWQTSAFEAGGVVWQDRGRGGAVHEEGARAGRGSLREAPAREGGGNTCGEGGRGGGRERPPHGAEDEKKRGGDGDGG